MLLKPQIAAALPSFGVCQAKLKWDRWNSFFSLCQASEWYFIILHCSIPNFDLNRALERLLRVHHLAEVFFTVYECHSEVLNSGQQADVRYDSYVKFKVRIVLALHLDVFLLLTWSVWSKVYIYLCMGCALCINAVSKVDLLPVILKEDHRDELAAY